MFVLTMRTSGYCLKKSWITFSCSKGAKCRENQFLVDLDFATKVFLNAFFHEKKNSESGAYSTIFVLTWEICDMENLCVALVEHSWFCGYCGGYNIVEFMLMWFSINSATSWPMRNICGKIFHRSTHTHYWKLEETIGTRTHSDPDPRPVLV